MKKNEQMLFLLKIVFCFQMTQTNHIHMNQLKTDALNVKHYDE